MKRFLRTILLLALLGGATAVASPVSAANFSIGINFPGVGFSYSSGGYCDSWGCPGDFWNYPIYYCPVFYDGRWYRGPVYYRYWRGRYMYWVHGGWRYDYWRGPRPSGACIDRYGPPLDLDFYIWNGFRIRDEWRYNWYRYRNDWWRRRQDWVRTNNNDTRWHNWLPAQQRNYDWNRERNWNATRDWTRRDWNRADWERRNGIVTGRPVTEAPATIPPANNRPVTQPTTRPAVITPTPPAGDRGRIRDRGGRNRSGEMAPTAPVVSPPAQKNPPVQDRGRNRDRSRGERGGAMAPSQMAPTVTPPNNGPFNDNRGRNRDRAGGAPPSQMAPSNNPRPGNNGDNRGNKTDRKGNRDNP